MTVNRERKTISAYTGSDLDLDYDTLKEAAERIQHLISLYGESARIEKRQESYSDYEYLAVYQDRLETDEEMDKRIREEEQREAWQAKREAEEYARLRAKFGDTK